MVLSEHLNVTHRGTFRTWPTFFRLRIYDGETYEHFCQEGYPTTHHVHAGEHGSVWTNNTLYHHLTDGIQQYSFRQRRTARTWNRWQTQAKTRWAPRVPCCRER